jgi:hypothetical protein
MIEKAPVLISEDNFSPIVGGLALRDSYYRGFYDSEGQPCLAHRNLCAFEKHDNDTDIWYCRGLINVLPDGKSEEVNFGIETCPSEAYVGGYDHGDIFGQERSYFREVTDFDLVRLMIGLFDYYKMRAKDQFDRKVGVFNENNDDLFSGDPFLDSLYSSPDMSFVRRSGVSWRLEGEHLFQNWLDTTMELNLLPIERRRLVHFNSLVLKRK